MIVKCKYCGNEFQEILDEDICDDCIVDKIKKIFPGN